MEKLWRWLSECDSIQSVTLTKSLLKEQNNKEKKFIQDSIEALEYENKFRYGCYVGKYIMGRNRRCYNEAEVEQITAVGVRGAKMKMKH